MLVLYGAGFLVILLSGLRQTPQSEDTDQFRAFFMCVYENGLRSNRKSINRVGLLLK